MLSSNELVALVRQGQQVATLGSGRFGTVSAYRRGDELIAIKKYRRDGPALARAERIIEERNCLQQVGHDNLYVVHLLGTGKDDDHLYFALSPVLGGPLHKHLFRCGKIGLQAVRDMTVEIVCALRHLAKHGVVHRDVKLSNVLLNERGHVVLCDFSSAKWIRENNDCTNLVDLKPTHTITGSSHSMAPEMLSGVGHSFPVDWWALGILVHEMITGEPFPWNRPSYSDATAVLEKAAVKALLERGDEPEDIPGCWRCVEITPSIFGHEVYIESRETAKNFVSVLLSVRPEQRWGLILDSGGSFRPRVSSFFDALECHPFFERIDWTAVHAGTCPPSYPDFDRRLGFLELIHSSTQQDVDISAEDQALFANF